MKISDERRDYIVTHFVNGFNLVDEYGISGYLTYRQMAKIVKYLEDNV